MSDKEVLRGQLIAQLIEGRLDQKSVAARLSISVRQVKCLKRNYAKEGIAGLSLRGAKVTVPSHTDGQMELLWQGRPLAF